MVRASHGRLRVELRGWAGGAPRRLAADVEQLRGVHEAEANPLTGRVLIRFDPGEADAAALLAGLATLPPLRGGADEDEEPAPADPPPALAKREGALTRARIAARGLDRDPGLAHRVVERLGTLPGVTRASASPLTGRMLVEFDPARIALAVLVAEVAALELPALEGEERPVHPLDPDPVLQSGSRLAGAALGLSMLALRGLAGRAGPPTSARGPAEAAALLGIVEGFATLRGGVRRLLGPRLSEVAFAGATVATLTLSGSTLGLAFAAAGALRAFTEARARRRGWERYEERVEHFPPVARDAVVRVSGGERVPLAAEVLEGEGTGEDRDGRLVAVRPGARLAAGTPLHGGSFLLALAADAPFEPGVRAVPPRRTLLEHYLEAVPWVALAYAALTAIVTRSPGRAFVAFVIVNPRAALAGAEAADRGASARVLRAGVTVAGTRGRALRRPDHLLLDGARPLVDGLEVAAVTPLAASDASEILPLAAKIAGACGSPWPRAFAPARIADIDDASFDGETATATIGGVRHSLGPASGSEPSRSVEATLVLALRRGDDPRPLGLVELAPRWAAGVDELVRACERRRVALALVADEEGAALARRRGIPAIRGEAVDEIPRLQAERAIVAFASDSAHAAPAFAVGDLAIGLASGRSGRFAARADLLAPDLGALAAIVEAGGRRDAAARDGALLALAGNAVGGFWGLRTLPPLQRAAYPLYLAALAALALGAVRLRGGERPLSLATLADPRPERWGREAPGDVLRAFATNADGLTGAGAARRRQRAPEAPAEHRLLAGIGAQASSPLTGLLARSAPSSRTPWAPVRTSRSSPPSSPSTARSERGRRLRPERPPTRSTAGRARARGSAAPASSASSGPRTSFPATSWSSRRETGSRPTRAC